MEANRRIGKCPKCSGDIMIGKYGAYCSGHCGMNLNYAFGMKLKESQIKDLCNWCQVYVRGLKRKKGGTFNAYIRPMRIEPYSYRSKDGYEKQGYRFVFSLEFPGSV